MRHGEYTIPHQPAPDTAIRRIKDGATGKTLHTPGGGSLWTVVMEDGEVIRLPKRTVRKSFMLSS